MSDRILICIDLQRDFITGPLGTPEAQTIIPNVKKKIKEYQKRGDEIIFTRDTHFDDYLDTSEGKKLPIPHCICRSDGWEIVDGLTVPNCRYVCKNTFGWMFWRDYSWANAKIELIGVCTDICVISNALILKATFPNAEIIVDASCCAGTTPEKHKAAMDVMRSCQINVIGEE